MSTVRVIAVEPGIYADSRRRVGDEFEYDLSEFSEMRLDERALCELLPDWVKPASPEVHAGIAQRAKAAEEKSRAAIIYASGTKGRKGSEKTFTEAMQAGRGEQKSGDPKGAEAALAASGTAGAKQKKAAYEGAMAAGRGPQVPITNAGEG